MCLVGSAYIFNVWVVLFALVIGVEPDSWAGHSYWHLRFGCMSEVLLRSAFKSFYKKHLYLSFSFLSATNQAHACSNFIHSVNNRFNLVHANFHCIYYLVYIIPCSNWFWALVSFGWVCITPYHLKVDIAKYLIDPSDHGQCITRS